MSDGLRKCQGWGAVVLLIAMQVIWFSPASAAPTGLAWSEPTRVSTNVPARVDWFPAVAADGLGNVHVIWNQTSYDDDKGHNATDPEAIGQLEYTRWNGQSWTRQTDLSLIWYGYALRNSLTVDPSGRLQILYKGWGTPDRPIAGRAFQDIWHMSAPASEADAVYAWGDRTRVSGGKPAYFTDVVADSKGTLHIIWTEGDANGIYALLYARSTDGGATWSQRVNLSGDDPVWWYRAHLTVDQSDRLHVVWEVLSDAVTKSTAGFGVTAWANYAQSDDGGRTWSRREFPGTVATTGSGLSAPGPQQPDVAVDGNGTIVLIYREYGTDRIMSRQSLDGTRWSAAEPLPGIKSGVARPYDIYDTARDSAGHVHLVAVGYPNGSSEMSVLHAEWTGSSWTLPEVIVSGAPYPEYPRLAIGSGNQLHVVWFGGDNASTNRTPVGIWYSTATASAPRVEQRPAVAADLTSARGANRVPAPTPKATPLSVTAVMPATDTLSAADRQTYTPGASEQLLKQPFLPIVASVFLSGFALSVVLLARQRRNHAQ